jgi:Zn-dependent peptidase ImmA (M78 family)
MPASTLSKFEPSDFSLISERLTEAREACCLNMAELAKRIGVSRQAVSQYELGLKRPDAETMIRIVRELQQPVSYFTTERPLGSGPSGTVFFRSFKSKTKASNRAFEVWRKWVGQVSNYLGDYVNLPPVRWLRLENLKDQYLEDEIEQIATDCRRFWGLGDGPIANMTALLESKGCIVTLSEFGVTNVDAFSCWQGDRPFVFLGSDKQSACRSRFNAAHELAHLVLHSGISRVEIEDSKVLDRIEREANRFASAFLLPARTFPSEVFSHRLAHFVELKRRWKVAIRAMAYRCQELGLFDDDRILAFWKQMSAMGYVKTEPLDDSIHNEFPQLLKKATELLLDNNVKTPSDLLSDLRLSVATIGKACRISEDKLASPELLPIDISPVLRAHPGE